MLPPLFDKNYNSLFLNAWARLVFAYFVSFGLSFAAGIFFIQILEVSPEAIFEFSTKRISYVFPIMEKGAALGLDRGVILFVWNTLGALVTISFLYMAPLFNPDNIDHFPRTLRKIFCGTRRMKLLCFLPGCRKIDEEPLRRLYVWLMIPWLGMLLLGFESGLTVSTSAYVFGSYLVGFASLVPHGIVEIPTISFAGAVTFTAHILVKEKVRRSITARIFENLNDYIRQVPLMKIILFIILFLMIAGLIEGHVTDSIIDTLLEFH